MGKEVSAFSEGRPEKLPGKTAFFELLEVDDLEPFRQFFHLFTAEKMDDETSHLVHILPAVNPLLIMGISDMAYRVK